MDLRRKYDEVKAVLNTPYLYSTYMKRRLRRMEQAAGHPQATKIDEAVEVKSLLAEKK